MKKLSEIKTGEKFEYQGKYYMGMEGECEFDGTPGVIPICLETGALWHFALEIDALVRPVELTISEVKVADAWYRSESEIVVRSSKKTYLERANEAMNHPLVPKLWSKLASNNELVLFSVSVDPCGCNLTLVKLDYDVKDSWTGKRVPEPSEGAVKAGCMVTDEMPLNAETAR